MRKNKIKWDNFFLKEIINLKIFKRNKNYEKKYNVEKEKNIAELVKNIIKSQYKFLCQIYKYSLNIYIQKKINLKKRINTKLY